MAGAARRADMAALWGICIFNFVCVVWFNSDVNTVKSNDNKIKSALNELQVKIVKHTKKYDIHTHYYNGKPKKEASD